MFGEKGIISIIFQKKCDKVRCRFSVPVLPHEQLSNFLRLIFLSTVVAVAYCDKCCGEENSLNISQDKPGQPQKSISPNQRELINEHL